MIDFTGLTRSPGKISTLDSEELSMEASYSQYPIQKIPLIPSPEIQRLQLLVNELRAKLKKKEKDAEEMLYEFKRLGKVQS